MSITTIQTRQMSFEDIQDKTKIRYIKVEKEKRMNKIQELKKFLIDNNLNNSIIEEESKIKVGEYLDLRGTQIRKSKSLQKLVEGYCKERNYIFFDGIYGET